DHPTRANARSSSSDDAHIHALRSLSRAHELRHYIDAEVSVESGSFTDLSVSLSYQSFRWSWELDFVGSKLSASILSQQLIMPLVIASGFAFNHHASIPIVDQTGSQLQKELDRAVKVVRNPHLGVVQALKRPRLTSCLTRTSATINGVDVERIPPVTTGFEEVATTLEESIPPPRSPPRPLPATDISVVTPIIPPSPPHLSPIHRKQGPLTKVDPDEDMAIPTNRQAVIRKLQDDDATDTEDDMDPVMEPPTKARRVVHDQSPSSDDFVSPFKRDGPSRVVMRPRMPILSDSDDDPPAHGGRGRGIAAGRLKQPVQRGGRRL
ncbi:hypothetical protein FRC17_006536, partial [Serendipita sp. 399]